MLTNELNHIEVTKSFGTVFEFWFGTHGKSYVIVVGGPKGHGSFLP